MSEGSAVLIVKQTSRVKITSPKAANIAQFLAEKINVTQNEWSGDAASVSLEDMGEMTVTYEAEVER